MTWRSSSPVRPVVRKPTSQQAGQHLCRPIIGAERPHYRGPMLPPTGFSALPLPANGVVSRHPPSYDTDGASKHRHVRRGMRSTTTERRSAPSATHEIIITAATRLPAHDATPFPCADAATEHLDPEVGTSTTAPAFQLRYSPLRSINGTKQAGSRDATLQLRQLCLYVDATMAASSYPQPRGARVFGCMATGVRCASPPRRRSPGSGKKLGSRSGNEAQNEPR